MTAVPLRCSIFCAIVDNFGDIGVCWRLARQLVAEHDVDVTLWVDDARLVEFFIQTLGLKMILKILRFNALMFLGIYNQYQ